MAAKGPASDPLAVAPDRQQGVSLERRTLPAGDYAIEAPGGHGLAAVVVEDRYAGVSKLEHVQPLAQEWVYRYLGAAAGPAQSS